jgi:hypothetical protein
MATHRRRPALLLALLLALVAQSASAALVSLSVGDRCLKLERDGRRRRRARGHGRRVRGRVVDGQRRARRFREDGELCLAPSSCAPGAPLVLQLASGGGCCLALNGTRLLCPGCTPLSLCADPEGTENDVHLASCDEPGADCWRAVAAL